MYDIHYLIYPVHLKNIIHYYKNCDITQLNSAIALLIGERYTCTYMRMFFHFLIIF